MTSDPLDVEAIVADTRASLDIVDDEEALVVVLLAGLPREVAILVDDGTAPAAAVARAVGPSLDRVGVDRAALVIPRRSGQCLPRDVGVLAAFRQALCRVEVVDLVVVGTDTHSRLEGRAAA